MPRTCRRKTSINSSQRRNLGCYICGELGFRSMRALRRHHADAHRDDGPPIAIPLALTMHLDAASSSDDSLIHLSKLSRNPGSRPIILGGGHRSTPIHRRPENRERNKWIRSKLRRARALTSPKPDPRLCCPMCAHFYRDPNCPSGGMTPSPQPFELPPTPSPATTTPDHLQPTPLDLSPYC